MLSLLEVLGQGLVNLVRSLHPRRLREFGRRMPLYGPLALRAVKRRPLRHLLVGLCLAAGVVVYLTLSAASHGSAVDVAGRTEALRLPADVLAFGLGGEGARPPEDLAWAAPVGGFEVFDRWEALTSAGRRWVVGLAPDSRLWPAGPDGPSPGPGEALVPRRLAEAAGLEPGDLLQVGVETPLGFSGEAFVVAGLFEAHDDLLAESVLVGLEDSLALRDRLGAGPTGPAGPRPDAVAVWVRSGSTLRQTLRRLESYFPEATLWWEGLPAQVSYRAVGGLLSPARVVKTTVLMLAGLGVFNVMLLSLLQRKTQLGVLKALGAEDDEVFHLLFLEGGLVAAGGLVLGLAGGWAVVRALDVSSELLLMLTPSAAAGAVVLAVACFYMASWLPATLCRRATPVQLMAGRRLYLDPHSTCAQCGRCGGF